MAKKRTAIAAIGVLASVALGDASFHTSYEGRVIRVIDGDTIEVAIEVAPGMVMEVDVRERDLDTPEKRRGGRGGAQCPEEQALGKKVSQLVSSYLKPGTSVGVVNVGLGKYAGRWVGDIRFMIDGSVHDLGDWLINQNLAVHYDGKTKAKVWCPKDETRAVSE